MVTKCPTFLPHVQYHKWEIWFSLISHVFYANRFTHMKTFRVFVFFFIDSHGHTLRAKSALRLYLPPLVVYRLWEALLQLISWKKINQWLFLIIFFNQWATSKIKQLPRASSVCRRSSCPFIGNNKCIYTVAFTEDETGWLLLFCHSLIFYRKKLRMIKRIMCKCASYENCNPYSYL